MELFGSNLILLPVSDNDSDKVTLFSVGVIAQKYDKKIVMLKVISTEEINKHESKIKFINNEKTRLREYAKNTLKDWYNKLSIITEVFEGEFRKQVLNIVKEKDPELLVLTMYNKNKRLLNSYFNNDTDYIIKHSKKPTLLIPEDFEFNLLTKSNSQITRLYKNYGIPQKVMVPIDFSKESAQALDTAINLSLIFKFTIYIIYVADPASKFNLPFLLSRRKLYSHYQQQINYFINSIMGYERGAYIKSSIVIGNPPEKILSVAKQENIDLIFLALKYKKLLAQIISGTITNDILYKTKIPIVTVPGSTKLLKIEEKFNKIFNKISILDLQKNLEIEDKNIKSDLFDFKIDQKSLEPNSNHSSSLVLGFYTKNGILTSLTEYGIIKELEKIGFNDFVIETNTDNPFHQIVKLFHGGKTNPKNLIAEVCFHEGIYIIKDGLKILEKNKHYQALYIDWLTLQNPIKSFSEKKPRLPGQQYPGLGLGYMIFNHLIMVAKRLNKDVIVNIPQRYYNSEMYHERCRFANPKSEALYLAIKRDTMGKKLSEIAWAIENEKLINIKNNKPLKWKGKKMLLAMHEDLQHYFEHENYHNMVAEKMLDYEFRCDWD